MKLIIPHRLPGLNEIIYQARGNKTISNAQKKKYTELVAWYCKIYKIKKLNKKADFIFSWYCQNKKRDKDNIMAGQKFIFDGLQSAGVIKNDGWKEIGNISHKFYIDKENERVEIEIVEVNQ